ncbi:helix-turn-helix domain-containing protein [Amycolatopsis sp. lyj-23]|uniref:helix-turn-helix domain-containing protein n=1 Tax=Amycolatopsis sp. lyj-23 TaxID=2789283 RepID=UPI0039792FFE
MAAVEPVEPVRFDDVDAGVFVPVGVLLRRMRDLKGWKQRDLAQHSGFSLSFVAGLEGGSRSVRRVPIIMRLADVLSVPREQLFAWVVAEIEHHEKVLRGDGK